MIGGGQFSEGEVEQIYRSASIVVFPSHYEGFGYPLLHALAANKPIFVRDLEVFREIWRALARNDNIHFFDVTSDLTQALQDNFPVWISKGGAGRSANRVRQYERRGGRAEACDCECAV